MNEKPEALMLADGLELHAAIPPGFPKGVAIPCVVSRADLSRAAAELRRQHAENERLTAVKLQAQNAVINLAKKTKRLRELLSRIRRWDHLDTAADGAFWKHEIDAALRREET